MKNRIAPQFHVYSLDNQLINTAVDLKNYAAGTYRVKVMPENITYQIVKQ